MSSAHANSSGKDPTNTEVRALMKVLIGVHPHKTSVAVAAIDEATGELLERASFPQNRAGSRALERWAKRFPERRWAVENAGGLGRHLSSQIGCSGRSLLPQEDRGGQIP
jgi:transposase